MNDMLIEIEFIELIIICGAGNVKADMYLVHPETQEGLMKTKTTKKE